jgi:hypothetical protein
MSPPGWVWCGLCALTVGSAAFAAFGAGAQIASTGIVLIAAAKARLVIVHYMELRQAAPHWRLLYEAWNLAAATTLIIGAWMGG